MIMVLTAAVNMAHTWFWVNTNRTEPGSGSCRVPKVGGCSILTDNILTDNIDNILTDNR